MAPSRPNHLERRLTRSVACAIFACSLLGSRPRAAAAQPSEPGDWDPRHIPSMPLLVTMQLLPGPFNWNLASYSQRRDFLVEKGMSESLATEAALGGAPLTPVRHDGVGIFLGNMSDGLISRGFGFVVRFF